MMLSLFVALPIFAGLLGYLMKDKGARGFGALIALLQLAIGVELTMWNVDPSGTNVLHSWIPRLGLNWSLGIDGGNVLLVLLTPLITALAILSISRRTTRLASFVASLLLLDGFLSGLFLSQNLGLFYVFFEAMLLPAIVLITGWSKKDGRSTAIKFLMYTMVGSLPMLIGILALAFTGTGAENLEFSSLGEIRETQQFFLFFPFLLAFVVKMPLVPFHGWLPTLYKNAPASVTVVIAALMSKAGTYGLMKVGYTVFPKAFGAIEGYLAVLAVITILYGAFAALGADSIKEVLAYSSLSHIAMIAFGLCTFELDGAAGAALQMVGHAVATGGMFLVVALFEKRGLPDQIRRYGGLAKCTPRLATYALFLTLASLGQPGLGSFPGELFIVAGAWHSFPSLTVLATVGIVLAAAYLLRWYQAIFTGEQGTYRDPVDLNNGERLLLSIPIGLTIALGFFPTWFLAPIQAWLEGVI